MYLQTPWAALLTSTLIPKGPGYEFGYTIFEEFPKIKTKTYEVNEVIVGTNKQIKTDSDLQEALHSMENQLHLNDLNVYNNKIPT